MSDSGHLHDLAHSNANDSISAVEAVIGVAGSTVTTSLTYQTNTNTASISNLSTSLASTNSQVAVTNSNLLSLTTTVNSLSSSVTALTANKLSLSGGTMTGSLKVAYNPVAVSASLYTNASLVASSITGGNPPSIGLNLPGTIGMALYLTSIGISTISNSGNGTNIIDAQGNLNPNAIPSGTLQAITLVPNSVTAGQIAPNSITNTQLAAGVSVANIGYTPVNQAGDTISGALTVSGVLTSNGVLRATSNLNVTGLSTLNAGINATGTMNFGNSAGADMKVFYGNCNPAANNATGSNAQISIRDTTGNLPGIEFFSSGKQWGNFFFDPNTNRFGHKTGANNASLAGIPWIIYTNSGVSPYGKQSATGWSNGDIWFQF